MKPNTATAEVVNAAEIDAIEMALGDLDLSFDEADAVVEEVVELDAESEAALEVELAKDEAYDELDAGSAIEDTTADPAPAAAKPARSKRTKSATAKPRAAKDLADVDPAFFVFTNVDANVPADLEANKLAVIAARPTIKKVAEKFDNVIMSIAAGKEPSVYVMDCFKVLVAKGEVTSGELVAALKATGLRSKKGGTYSDGTARSQAGQIMALFPTLGIAERTKNSLKLRTDSAYADALKTLAGL